MWWASKHPGLDGSDIFPSYANLYSNLLEYDESSVTRRNHGASAALQLAANVMAILCLVNLAGPNRQIP